MMTLEQIEGMSFLRYFSHGYKTLKSWPQYKSS
jgi:hypothetical protein